LSYKNKKTRTLDWTLVKSEKRNSKDNNEIFHGE